MLDFSVSLVPLFVVAIVNFVLSWVYYSPMVPWFKAWVVGTGNDPNKKEMTEAEKKEFPGIMLGALASTFLLAYGLQVFVHSIHAADFVTGALVGLAAWLTFAVTHSLNSRFEGRKVVILVINNGLYLVTYVVYGGLLAVWR